MRKLVKKQKNLSLIEGLVSKIIIKNKRATGVQLESGQIFSAKKIILTTGTYMGSIVFRGDFSEKSGPSGEKTTSKISQQLKVIGFKLLRLKTGTPPRIIRKTIDFKKTIPVSGSDLKLAFSHKTKNYLAFSKMESCYLLATNEDTHKIVKNNLLLSPMFNRKKKGKGPRHCPSIEDKVAFFAGKKYHQLFLEPEAKILPTMYLQGLSTSLPSFVQEKILKTIPALKNCQVAKWGYAIEYDALNPIQLQPTLETKLVASLYTAGQINGTSGYEEAAAQGLIAGINAVLKLKNQKPFILKRKEAYIAVLIDDLVTKGTIEPYRLLTSQAEYRLLIRNDNAETRLLEKGYRLGTISKTTYYFFLRKKQLKQKIITFLKRKIVVKKTTSAREIFQEFGYDQKVKAETAKSILARFQVKLLPLLKILSFKKLPELKVLNFNDVTEIETEIKYAGYLEKQLKMIKQTEKFMEKKIPSSIDYEQSENITKEAKEKLSAVRPQTIFQASQIPGVT